MELKVGDYLVKKADITHGTTPFTRAIHRVEVIGLCGDVIFLGYRNLEGKLFPFPPFATMDYIIAEGWKKVEIQ